jgi:AcrR family transcriptional regulator
MPTRAKTPPEDDADSPATREERKQRTRAHLMEAALVLMAQGRSFTGLGLREITREAGVVPTSFYRHFRDMDELGFALVEEGARTLRHMLREARQGGVAIEDIIRRSVVIYKQYVSDHPLHFRFIVSERNGGSIAIRNAIRQNMKLFVSEMAQDLRHLGFRSDLSTAALEMLCGIVVNLMLNHAGDILDLPPKQPRLEQELVEIFVKQLRLVFIGALAWREAPASG